MSSYALLTLVRKGLLQFHGSPYHPSVTTCGNPLPPSQTEHIVSQWNPQQYDPGQPQQPPWDGAPPAFTSRQPPIVQPGVRENVQMNVRQRPRYGRGVWAFGWTAVAVIAVLAGTVTYLMHKVASLEAAVPAPPAVAASTAPRPPAEPETKAGVRASATAFYDLYAASQWAQAWAYLAPATQRAVSAKTWTEVHEQCTDHTAGLARTIKSVTLAGGTAVVDETVAGALGKLGTVSDAWGYSAGRWGLGLPASSMAVYSHGSVKADVTAAKAAGECAS